MKDYSCWWQSCSRVCLPFVRSSKDGTKLQQEFLKNISTHHLKSLVNFENISSDYSDRGSFVNYCFLKIGQTAASFSFIFIFFKPTIQFLQQSNVKNVKTIQYMAPGFKPTTSQTEVVSHNHKTRASALLLFCFVRKII